MGIESLYSQWIARSAYPNVISKRLPPKIASLFLDTNGILHAVAQEVYAYGNGDTEENRDRVKRYNDEELFIQYGKQLALKLDQVVDTIKPTRTLIIAVDGVAPPAKLVQQRMRRYRDANGKEFFPEEKRFNTTNITPGTTFMTQVNIII